jgi:hypothetical protein
MLVFVLSMVNVEAQPHYDRHVAFDNSLTTPEYFYSSGEVVAPSDLELVKSKLPVDTTTCRTPPNCLRLKWRSGKGGDWRATLNLRHFYGNIDLAGDTLSFWVYSDATLPPAAAPRIYVTDSKDVGSPSIGLLTKTGALPARKWTRVTLPFSSFVGIFGDTSDVAFDPAHLRAITIVQGLDDDAQHTLLIDDVRVADEPSATRLSSPGVISIAIPASGCAPSQ